MNEAELSFFTGGEQRLPDCTTLPATYLLKCLFIKVRRRLLGGFEAGTRFVWTVTAVSDADGPAAAVRNYLDQRTIRGILADLTRQRKITRACEIGCGYGRVIMTLKEFAEFVKGFERERHLVEIARSLLPDIEFDWVESLACIGDKEPYDLVMTCTVLQHLTDVDAREVCAAMKRLAPSGYILCIEKTEAISTTSSSEDGKRFISRTRSVDAYKELMQPYDLVTVRNRVVEPTYFNPHPGTCMLFASPAAQQARL